MFARRHIATLLLLATCRVWAASPAEDCRRDLADLPGFMLENDAGGKDQLARQGAAHFDAALAEANQQADAVQTDDACFGVIRNYLRAWRTTHLALKPIRVASTEDQAVEDRYHADRMPALRVLSNRTLLLTLGSFDYRTREPLVQLLKSRRRDFESHPDWIIDVRANDGGEDGSYAPLLPWLLANGSVQVGARVFVTPANIAAWERVCPAEAPGDADCVKAMAPIIARMKTAATGDYMAMYDGHEIEFNAPDSTALRRPQRVAILIDQQCGSSCEQFLLEARQSFSVKLVGRHTWGGLDYSNLLAHDLPSGKRRLSYATTRSLRIPDLPVDGLGVLPDIALPRGAGDGAAQQEIERVRRWIEGGTLAP